MPYEPLNPEAVERLRSNHTTVGFHNLWNTANLWIRDEQYLLNERQWREDGSVPGRLTNVGIPNTVDHILCYNRIWDVFLDNVSDSLRSDPDFRLELINIGLFGGTGPSPAMVRPGSDREKAVLYAWATGDMVRDEISQYWIQWDRDNLGKDGISPGYLDMAMVHHFCRNHNMMPLEVKIADHLKL